MLCESSLDGLAAHVHAAARASTEQVGHLDAGGRAGRQVAEVAVRAVGSVGARLVHDGGAVLELRKPLVLV
jgi:hypothetical protein